MSKMKMKTKKQHYTNEMFENVLNHITSNPQQTLLDFERDWDLVADEYFMELYMEDAGEVYDDAVWDITNNIVDYVCNKLYGDSLEDEGWDEFELQYDVTKTLIQNNVYTFTVK